MSSERLSLLLQSVPFPSQQQSLNSIFNFNQNRAQGYNEEMESSENGQQLFDTNSISTSCSMDNSRLRIDTLEKKVDKLQHTQASILDTQASILDNLVSLTQSTKQISRQVQENTKAIHYLVELNKKESKKTKQICRQVQENTKTIQYLVELNRRENKKPVNSVLQFRKKAVSNLHNSKITSKITINNKKEVPAIIKLMLKSWELKSITTKYSFCYKLTYQRARVIKWLMQALTEINFSREAFALTVCYFDVYLAQNSSISVEKLQLIAWSALMLSSKIDGNYLKVSQLKSQKFQLRQIQQYEIKICQSLKWKLNLPTLNMWANQVIHLWDNYLQSRSQTMPALIRTNLQEIAFTNHKSYINYRTLMQYIDLTLFDISSLQYDKNSIAASFIFLILSSTLGLANHNEIYSWRNQLFTQNDLSKFYSEFLSIAFGSSLQLIKPTIQYCSKFILLPLDFSLPPGISEQHDLSRSFAQFCCFMTENKANWHYLNQRLKLFEQ